MQRCHPIRDLIGKYNHYEHAIVTALVSELHLDIGYNLVVQLLLFTRVLVRVGAILFA